jgi:hypothetical protein
MPFPRNMSSVSAIITAFRQCLPSSYLALDIHVTLLPPQDCSSRIGYRCITVFSFWVFCSFCHFPLARFFLRWLLSNRYHRSLLKSARPERLSDKVRLNPGASSSAKPIPCPQQWGPNCPKWPILPYFRLLLRKYASRLFKHFGGGRPLHNAQSAIFVTRRNKKVYISGVTRDEQWRAVDRMVVRVFIGASLQLNVQL